MARKKSATLTEAELRLMDILWEKGKATVGDVVEALPGRAPLAYNTVLTTMRILEQKGYVRHNESGRAFVYAPVVDREQAQRSAVKQLVTRFFDNSPGLLALNVLENEKLDATEIDRLKRIIKASETTD
ncbi:MAG TPA: BlaI/MecI/CopY family transcriptional regulator [Candidatus Eremiobacteraceae bacterium]|nr:BlaI/MecI/CopY family transcriptional regulator [Candidatus Eremiobacteraceae bacterium]